MTLHSLAALVCSCHWLQAMDVQAAASALDPCLEAWAAIQARASNITTTTTTTGSGSSPAVTTTDAADAAVSAAAAAQHACISARRAVYLAIARSGAWSRSARLAVYQYLRMLRRSGAAAADACRSDGPGAERDTRPTAHMQLMHAVQSLDPEDPWMQVRG